MIDEKTRNGQEGNYLVVMSMPIRKEKTEKIGIHLAEILVEARVFMFVLIFVVS